MSGEPERLERVNAQMLEALKAFIAAEDDFRISADGYPKQHDAMSGAYDQARAAIHQEEERRRMRGESDDANPHARRMKEVFDFESRPGLAMVRPEVAKRLTEGYKRQQAERLAEEARMQRTLPLQPYHPDDEEEEDGVCGRTWYLEWDMWVFILLCLLSLAGVWQMGEWACDLWNWLKRGML